MPEMQSTNVLIEVMDDLASETLHSQAWLQCLGSGWSFGNLSNSEHATPFWKMDLGSSPYFDAIWEAARPRCEELAGKKLRVLRQYANGHTFGLGGQPHYDDDRPGTYTLLYFPMIEWKPSWQGETVFHDESGEIRLSITPKPNRAVFFDARISHAGRAPSRSCPALRVSVAFKLQAIEECETATSEAQPVEITEQTRDGAHREYRIHARADFLEGRIRDRLQELGKTIKLPGFRSGRIPLTVLQSRYGERTRAQIIERIGSEAAERILAGGGLPASLQLTGGAESGDVEFLIAVTHLPDLPNVECESWKLERLTASESAAQRAGLSADEAKHLLSQVLHQEVLDYLHAAYSFPVASVLVERELARIRKAAAETQPDVNSETESVLAELREIAERRVRLGALLAELARRHHLAAGNDKPAIEGRVLDWLIARAQVTERPVTAEELRELDE